MPERVFVTGGADSVGRAVAERSLCRGDTVFICDLRPEALQDCLDANPGMRGCVADVGRPHDLLRALDQAVLEIGPPSVLVNNVGIGGERAQIEDLALDAWEQTFAVNVTGPMLAMQRVVPAMKAAGTGAIVNISTGSTRTRLPLRTPYVASKYALEGLTLNAARELGPYGIRCNAILPGMINNARMQGIVAANATATGRAPEAVEADYLKYISLRSKTEPEEIADMILFLASPAGAKVTGELLAVSGNVEWEI